MAFEKNPFFSTNFDLEENIFFFHNADIDPLAFVLDLDTRDNFFLLLLNRFFADVLDVPDEHTMVLANPDMTRYFHTTIPAFNIRYIEDCFKFKTFPDPTEYFIKNSCPQKYTKDQIFDCWFHRTKSWSDLIPIQKHDDSKIEVNGIEAGLKTCVLRENDSSNDSECSTVSISFFKTHKRRRLPYSHKEDVAIVKYIVKNKNALDIGGKFMWEMMERAKMCKHRSWQSLKERYIKRIKFDLVSDSDKFSFLSPEDLKILRQGLGIEYMKKSDKEKQRSIFQDERQLFSDDSV